MAGTPRGNIIGLAGELRVMSELLLRGHNPAKSYLANGADLILENGLRIEVKSSNKCTYKVKDQRLRKKEPNKIRLRNICAYRFTFSGGYHGKSKYQNLDNFDFVICWCIDDNVFYIVPRKKLSGSFGFCDTSPNAKHKYTQYRENWKELRR